MDRWIIDARGLMVPCKDLFTWAEWFERESEKYHLVDKIEGVRISTVFLGVDHRFGTKGDPILWETMIFNDDWDETLGQFRFCLESEAHACHKEWVAKYREILATTAACSATD